VTNDAFSPVADIPPKSKSSGSVWDIIVVFGRGIGPFLGTSGVSNLLFRTLSSFTAKSSKPNDINFPTNVDMPFSNCNVGNVTSCDVGAESTRRHANAIRAHSAVGLHVEEIDDAEEEDRFSLVAMLGELRTRLRDRACSGDGGNELDLRSPLLVVDLTKSFPGTGRWIGVEDWALIASLRLLSVAFMTSVAKIDLSFGDK
jgi:hypothetical protein